MSLVVPLPIGETRLAEIGLYRVGWQSDGQEPVAMPVSWSGHFDDATGISYKLWGRVLDREALLLHSPWRVPPGRTWVDSPTCPAAGRSGSHSPSRWGRTSPSPTRATASRFPVCDPLAQASRASCCASTGIKARGANTRSIYPPWRAGLSRCGWQVEPGPKHNASFDYSFFGDAKLTVGDAKSSQPDTLRRLLATKSYQATASASLLALSNQPALGVAPSSLLPQRNTLAASGSNWVFTCEGSVGRVVYTYAPHTRTLDHFTVQLDAARPFQPALGGGATAVVNVDGKPKQIPLRGGRPLELARDGNTLRVRWLYDSYAATCATRLGVLRARQGAARQRAR